MLPTQERLHAAAARLWRNKDCRACGERVRGCEILEEMEDHLEEIGYIFAQNDAMALGAVDYLHRSGKDVRRQGVYCARCRKKGRLP